MSAWWSSLSVAQQAFYVIAFLGTGVSAVQFLLLVLGVGVYDLPESGALHVGGPGEHPSGLQALSLRTITAFLTGFGWTGVISLASGGALPWAVALASVIGLAFAWALLALMRSMCRLGHDGSIDYANAVGSVATVYIPIPPRGAAGGQVELLVQGRMATVAAISLAEAAIPSGAKVRVAELADRTTLVVTPV
jgi:hypothetical protein